jgi:serine/threonine protein kinase
LAWLQKRNISHRDLKPQNVLYYGNGVYKIADFGEAKEVKIKTRQVNTIRGTELYMAPVLFDALKLNREDIPHNSYKSDVFSFGFCLIYAASLTFNCLYEIRELKNMEVVTNIVSKYLKTRYSSNLINLILKMVDIDEHRRYDFIELDEYINKNF